MIYEITYILKPELSNEDQTTFNEKIAKIVLDMGGKVSSTERTFSFARGGADENNLRKFAFPIRKYRQGFYYTSVFELEPSRLKELHTTLDREEEILRFLIVKDFIPLEEINEEEVISQKAQDKVLQEIETESQEVLKDTSSRTKKKGETSR